MMNAKEARKATEMAKEELRKVEMEKVMKHLEEVVAPKVEQATAERKFSCLVDGMDTIERTIALTNEIKALGYTVTRLTTSNELKLEW